MVAVNIGLAQLAYIVYISNMNKLIQIVFALLVMTSCDIFYPEIYSVPSEIEPYLSEYKKQADLRGVYINISNIEISFSNNLADDNQAYVKHRHETIVMKINNEIWDSYENDSSKREAVIFHELSHKVLNRGHVEDDSLSLMQRRPNLEMYKHQRNYLLDELFQAKEL